MFKPVHKYYTLLLTCLLIFSVSISYGINQPEIIKDEVRKENIKSIQLFRDGWRLSYPIIELNGEVSLVLKFDDLSPDIRNYHFKIVHCDAEWRPTPLSETEYMEGFYQNQLEDYDYSFNTYTGYVHYTLKIPNEEMYFKLSGNYAIIVYEDFDEENIAFIRRFMVTEKLVNLKADVQRPVLSIYRDNSQQVNFNIEYGSFRIDDPFSDIKVVVLQNGRWDNAITDLKPLFDRNGELIYDYQQGNIFAGGSEFRWFDTKSLRYQSPYIKKVEFTGSIFEVELFPEENRERKVYFYDEDLNGKYFPEIQEEEDNDTDADYVMVHFMYPFTPPMVDGDFYIFGALTNWQMDDRNRMTYDHGDSSYHLSLLLKQGYYNYHIAYKDKNSNVADLSYSEGNHYETENDYLILVYHYGTTSRYERLIGYQIVNSVMKSN